MDAGDDQLARLGQEVVDAVVASYNPHNDPSLALALHPGQALADDIVQNGVTNPLRLSEWIEDQYDYPLWLKRSDASTVSASSVGGVSAKSAYLAMIPWAQPTVPPDAPAFSRISAMIADARKDLGDNPDALPFSCEPTDFAEPDSAVWHVFDRTISSATATTNTSAAPVHINPMLWKMRVLTPEFVKGLMPAPPMSVQRKALAAAILDTSRPQAFNKFSVLRNLTRSTSVAAPIRSMAARTRTIPLRTLSAQMDAPPKHMATLEMPQTRQFSKLEAESQHVADAGSPIPTNRAFHAVVRDRLATIQVRDLVEAPVVEDVTTTGSELHAHFEYCMVTITRRLAGTRWWHSELINEDDWYVPGMALGAMVPGSTDGGYIQCLPQALLLVRNVALTGTWTADARSSLTSQVAFVGPFLMQAPMASAVSSTSTQQISVLGQGIQVIGELCATLPALPPSDGPSL